MAKMESWRGVGVFAALAALLIISTLRTFSGAGPLSWTVGFAYIGYDTFLLAFVLRQVLLINAEVAPAEVAGQTRVSIAVLITARNEATVLATCLAALDAQSDPPDSIVWVDDGSTDSTRSELAQLNGRRVEAGRNEILTHFKAHSGKADSLNQAWPRAQADVVVTLDADTLLDKNAILEIRRAFAANPRLAVTGGLLTPYSLVSPGGAFESFQRFEYIRSFLARRAWMGRDALLLVSGAFAAYRKTVLEQVGGFDPRSLVEDYDLTHRIHRYSFDHGLHHEVHVTVDARAVTDVPATVTRFLKQRQRWFAGFLQTQFKNLDMVGNKKYGSVGRLMMVVKSADTLQPLFGLAALGGLVLFPLTGRAIPTIIWLALLAKIVIDLAFHFYSIRLYYRWKRETPPLRTWFHSALSTFLEPITFQILRHLGALLGWIAFLRGTSDWTPQRKAAFSPGSAK